MCVCPRRLCNHYQEKLERANRASEIGLQFGGFKSAIFEGIQKPPKPHYESMMSLFMGNCLRPDDRGDDAS